MRYLLLIPLFFILAIVHVQGQEAIDSTPYLIEYDTQGNFWTIDTASAQKHLFFEFHSSLGYVKYADIDIHNQQLYILDAENLDATLGDTTLVQVDLQTLTPKIVLERPNILYFQLSPNKQQAIITGFPPDFETVRHQMIADVGFCILVFSRGRCEPSSQEINVYSADARWISDKWIRTMPYGTGSSYLMNIETGQQFELPFVPSTHILHPFVPNRLILHDSKNEQNYLLNLDNFDIEPYRFSSLVASAPDDTSWVKFSPNRRLTLMFDEIFTITDYITGEVITELGDIYNPQWLSNSEIVAFRSDSAATRELVIFNIELDSTVVVPIEAEERIIVIPNGETS
jgi:hypothetical protein